MERKIVGFVVKGSVKLSVPQTGRSKKYTVSDRAPYKNHLNEPKLNLYK